MVKVGPRLPGPSRREIEKREKEQRRAAQIENGEHFQSPETEVVELLEPAAQRKRARHRNIADADLENSKRKREKTLKRREARRLARQAERERARREGSQGCVEDSLEFLLAEIDRCYNDSGHLASQTPITRSEPQQNDAGDSFVLPSTDEAMEGVTASLNFSTTTDSDIHLPLVNPSYSMMTIDTIATAEDPFQMLVPEALEELNSISLNTSAAVSLEEPKPMLVTSDFQLPMSFHHPHDDVVASEVATTTYQPHQDITDWLPVLQLPGSLSQTFASTPATMPETAVPSPGSSGATRLLEVPSLRSSLPSVDSSANPSISSEPLNASDFSSSNSGPSSASLNLPETPRASVRGAVRVVPNDSLALNPLASLTSQALPSSMLPSDSGSSPTRASDMDLGSTASSTSAVYSLSTFTTEMSVPGSLGMRASAEEPPSSQYGGTLAPGPSSGSLAPGVVNHSQATTSAPIGTHLMSSERTTVPRAAVAPPSTASLPTRAIADTLLNLRQGSSGSNSSSATNSAAHLEVGTRSAVPNQSINAIASTRTQSTASLTSVTSGTAQAPLAIVSSRPRSNVPAVTRAQSRTVGVVGTTPGTLTAVNQMAPMLPNFEIVNIPPLVAGNSRSLVNRTAAASRNVVPSPAPRLFPPTFAAFRELVDAGRRPTLGNVLARLPPVANPAGNTANTAMSPVRNRGVFTEITAALNVGLPTEAGCVSPRDGQLEGGTVENSAGTVADRVADENQPPTPAVSVPASSEGGETQPKVPEVGSPVGLSGMSVTKEGEENEPPAPQVDAPVDPSGASIPEVNLPDDEDPAVVGPALTRQRVRSDTFSSNISDSTNAETTELSGRVPAADGVTRGTDLFPCLAGSNEEETSTTLLAPAAPIVEDLKRRPVPESANDMASEQPRTACVEVEPTDILRTATIASVVSRPNTPFSEPTYPDTPQPRSGIIPPYSTPTSQSPRIFTLELPSPRKAGKAAPVLPIHDPHVCRAEEKRGISIVNALKWVLRKTFGYLLQRRG